MDRCVQKDRSICFLFIVERWLVDWLGGREIGILKFYISSVFSFPYRRSGKYIILVVGKARKVFSTACVFGPRFDRGNACIPTFFFFFFFFVWSTCFCELGRIKKYVNFTENSCFCILQYRILQISNCSLVREILYSKYSYFRTLSLDQIEKLVIHKLISFDSI